MSKPRNRPGQPTATVKAAPAPPAPNANAFVSEVNGELVGTSLTLKRPDGSTYLAAAHTNGMDILTLTGPDDITVSITTDKMFGACVLFFSAKTDGHGAELAISTRNKQPVIQVRRGDDVTFVDVDDLFALAELKNECKSAAAMALPPDKWDEALRNGGFSEQEIEDLKVSGFPILTIISLLASLGPYAYQIIKKLLDNWKKPS